MSYPNMKLLPYENLEFDSPFGNSEVEELLKAHIVWTKQFGNVFTKKYI